MISNFVKSQKGLQTCLPLSCSELKVVRAHNTYKLHNGNNILSEPLITGQHETFV